ncbi:hypothetical protein HY085_01750 [Candidatus Gottesmanbacteria bacterium]|nr:hypothetical protein [Candidatus Gottesmanbacteria bacterium]
MNELQINRLSEILGNLSLLVFGTWVLPIFLGSVINTDIIFSSIIISVISLFWSLFILKGGKK